MGISWTCGIRRELSRSPLLFFWSVQLSDETIAEFSVLLTVHLITIFVNDQLDAQFFFLHLFIPITNMFRATKCSSSGESIVAIRPLVYVALKTDEWSRVTKLQKK